MAVDIDLVLAALDGSDEAATAAEYAVALADRYGANVHLLHVVEQRVMQGLETGDVTPETVAEHQQSVTETANQNLPDTVSCTTSTVVGFSTDRLGQTPGSVTLDVAEDLDADLIVVPRQTPGTSADGVIGKAALYILEYASQPVLSV